MKQEIIYNLTRLPTAIFFMLFLYFLMFVVEYAYIRHLTYYSDYFEYQSITSTKQSYEVWEDIFFISHIIREKPLYMEYSDILRCQIPWTDYTWYSSTITKSKLIDKTWEFTSEWRYEWDIPKTPARCYLDSQPSVLLDYGLKKTQRLRSNYFIIEDTK